MGKYRVPFKVDVTVYVEVEAECPLEAIEVAWNEVGVSSYVGNGGSDKLIGVSNHNHSIEASDDLEPIESQVEKI